MSVTREVLPYKASFFIVAVIVAGLSIFVFSLLEAILEKSLAWSYLVCLTAMGSFFPVRLPYVRRRNQALIVTINDVFIYTALLFFSPEVAVLVAATDGFCAGFRLVKREKLSRISFNVGQNSITTFLVGHLFYRLQGASPPLDPSLLDGDGTWLLFINLGLCAMSYFLLNSGAVAFVISLSTGEGAKQLWKENFLWASVTTVAGASTAAVIFLNFDRTPLFATGIATSIVLVIYSAYKMNLSKIRQAQAHVEELDQLYHSTIASLAMAIDAKDQSTHGHVQRVQTLTLGLARRCGVQGEEELKGLRAAALLHDIGKLAVPEYILNKPGPLTDAEMQKMRAHPVVGADILDTVPFPYPVTPYVRHHHERWDGKGYPDGLKADEIPLGARILAIVDCYDALRSDRPYRPSWDQKTTLEYIQGEAGKAYDPTIVRVMVESIEELEEEIQAAQRAIPKQVLETIEDSLNQLREDESSKIRKTVFHDIASTHKAVQAVYELSRSIGQSLNVEETLKMLASSIKQFVPYSTCSIYLVNSRDDRVLPHFVSGMYRDILEGLEVKLGEGITGWVAANNKTLVNVSPTPEFLNLEQLRAVFKSCLAVPLSIDNNAVGVITLYSNEERVYKTDHLNLMETVAPHAASAINNAIIHEETREDAYTDLLTGLPNLRYLNSFIQEELARAERIGYQVTILMMDLERFKAVNDEHGHRAGDRVLVGFSRILRERLRMSDICIRYGGDEFVGILPGVNQEMAHEMILRIQNSIESHPIRIADDHFIHIGVSIGSATYPIDGIDHHRLLNLADRTMYENKLLRAQKGYGSQILPFEKRSDNG